MGSMVIVNKSCKVATPCKTYIERLIDMFKKVLIVLAIFTVLGLMWGCESTYTRQAEVISVENDIVQAEDKSGYVWEYKGSATVGDSVTLVMHDNHTSNITDDIVKGVK